MKKIICFIATYLILFTGNSHAQQSLLSKITSSTHIDTDELINSAIQYSENNLELLHHNNVQIKYISNDYIFFNCTNKTFAILKKTYPLLSFHQENSLPVLMDDTARAIHQVDAVQNGLLGIDTSYTGKGILIGFVDTGVDFKHPDFSDENGKTRVIRYWDQTDATVSNKYTKYGYGRLWTQTDLHNNTCTAIDNSGHGTTVVGRAAGNGKSVGMNKGFAPEASIVMVETNLSANNWTLTVADACDYIFKLADSLNLPCVINLSVGIYSGSHDGNDVAGSYISSLVQQKAGRIVVASGGNAGNIGNFHVKGINSNDTTFVWFKNNPSSPVIGNNKIYMDVWFDSLSAQNIDFSIGADRPAPNYGFINRTAFNNVYTLAQNGNLFRDTIYNSNHQRIGTYMYAANFNSGVIELEVYFDIVDSTSYLYRFITKGSGYYNCWSTTNQVLYFNDMISSNLPSSSLVPDINKYQLPDNNQAIASSFNSSKNVITVANMKSRRSHIDKNGTTYISQPTNIAIGQIYISSSKGPNRLGETKPDITAAGEIGIEAVPSTFYSNPSNYSAVDANGFQGRNGGTSIASPTVAGMAALYLQKCPKSTFQDFRLDLITSAKSDAFTGVVPNNIYGYGKANALDLMLKLRPKNTLIGANSICSDPIIAKISSFNGIDSVLWNNGSKNDSIQIIGADTVSAKIYFGKGCILHSDTLIVKQNQVLPNPIITNYGDSISSDSQPNYQWYFNTIALTGDTLQTIHILSSQNGQYQVSTISNDGCISTSTIIQSTASLTEQKTDEFTYYPNPIIDNLTIKSKCKISKISCFDYNGKIVPIKKIDEQHYDFKEVKTGEYLIKFESEKGNFYAKVIKM